MARRRRKPKLIGWREWAALPDLGVDRIKVKIDTGARTSAMHAFRLHCIEVEGEPVADFEIHPRQRSASDAVRVQYPIAGWRKIRSSNGAIQERPVIRTKLKLAGVCWPVDVTLTNRDEMGFRMLIGRAAIRRRFYVDPGHSYLGERQVDEARSG
jgi:hypothetical protein